MAHIAANQDRPQSHPTARVVDALARLYWFLGGTSALYVTALALTQAGTAAAWPVHLAYWTIMASLVLVRYVDVRWLGGTTASGEPATRQHRRRYAARVLLAASCLYVGSHAVARTGLW